LLVINIDHTKMTVNVRSRHGSIRQSAGVFTSMRVYFFAQS
jgi:hypothetical protein